MRNKYFYTINDFLKEKFDTKVIKLSLDGGFTCPNRDGTVGTGGCIFCSESGSGEFSGDSKLSISEQIQSQINFLSTKWQNAKYIAYFQNFTNTYAPTEYLRKIYDEALSNENVVGLAIATRPDCLSDEVIELLCEYNSKTFLWLELGLQTIHSKSTKFIRRGYDLKTFDSAMHTLNSKNIKTVAHIIVNLPNETDGEIFESIEYVCDSGIWGIKLHMLNILKNTDLACYFDKHPFYLKDADEYISLISNFLSKIPPHIVIHRLTGDGDKKSLITPRWILNKRYILNGIQKYMRENNLYQGKYYNDIS